MSASFFCCNTSAWALIEYVLYCHILWWISYYFLLLVTRQSEEWCCRVLTFVHGCIISYSAVKDILINKNPIDFTGIPLSPHKKTYLSYMLSYFMFDFCWIHFFGNETWVIYAHHAVSILIIIYVLVKNYGGTGIAYGIAGLELTNPYLQLRWFLRTHGYLNKPVHTITELWFMLLFFLFRIIGGTVLLYYAFLRSQTDWGIKISFLCIYGISLVLQWHIAVYFKKKYLTSRNFTTVSFIHSRVSISPYFQRRTMDNVDHAYESEEAAPDKETTVGRVHESEEDEPNENKSVVMSIHSTVTTNAFSTEETPETTQGSGGGPEKSEPKEETNKPSEETEEAPPEAPPEPPEPPEEPPEESTDDQNKNDSTPE